METDEQERRAFLRRKLKRLTKTSDWMGDPVTRSLVREIRADLYPHAFRVTDRQISLGLLKTSEPRYKSK